MPFTPFHLGPGLAFKALGGKYFSIVIFGITQVAIDIEPLVGLFCGSGELHGVTHTYLGATVIAGIGWLFSTPIYRVILTRWNREVEHYGFTSLRFPVSMRQLPIAISAFTGSYSHIILDSIMHFDAKPFSPFFNTNSLYNICSIEKLHWLCVALGFAGICIWLIKYLSIRFKSPIKSIKTLSRSFGQKPF